MNHIFWKNGWQTWRFTSTFCIVVSIKFAKSWEFNKECCQKRSLVTSWKWNAPILTRIFLADNFNSTVLLASLAKHLAYTAIGSALNSLTAFYKTCTFQVLRWFQIVNLYFQVARAVKCLRDRSWVVTIKTHSCADVSSIIDKCYSQKLRKFY